MRKSAIYTHYSLYLYQNYTRVANESKGVILHKTTLKTQPFFIAKNSTFAPFDIKKSETPQAVKYRIWFPAQDSV